MTGLLSAYPSTPGCFDELIAGDGGPRGEFRRCLEMLDALTADEFARLQSLAELALLNQGVTFSVYKDARGTEKIFPFCLIPRIISAADWARLERGLEQRLRALNLFLDDMYGEQRILAAGVVPRELVLGAAAYDPRLRGVRPPGGVRVHIAGVDLIRDPDGTFRVLEDNLRTPSGVSYVVENRVVSKRIYPRVVDAGRVQRVDHYPERLADALRSVSPVAPEDTTIVVLTPGPYNSAYFEHTFLARNMGVELVQGSDLFVERDEVFLRTTRGPRRVDVIYRRIDDAFLDPEVGRPDSLLGVRGLIRAWAAGKVTLVNAPGNGVADDKAVYPFVPDMIRFFLGEEPLLDQVPTHVCLRDDDRRYVLEHLPELVVKAVDEAGGYGMLMGPQASAAERDDFARRIRAEPRRYIAQPRIELSTCPTWLPDRRRVEPRRVDLRPYVVTSREGPWVLPGGLTRVALVEGSYVVNSSQGGGSKDTWVLTVRPKGAPLSSREPQGLISRVADSCMWFGRYVERGESTSRDLESTLSLALDGELTQRQCWFPAVVVAGEEVAFRERRGDAAFEDGEEVQRYLVWDEDCTVAVRRSIAGARENARAIRDVLSGEVWETINQLHLWLESGAARADFQSQRDGFYRRVRRDAQLCLGLLRSTMLHDTALDFTWLGMLLERVGQTARLLDVHHHAFSVDRHTHPVVETSVWMALLRACSGVEPFMRAHAGRVTGDTVAGFLLGEARFPRSVAYCVHSAYDRLCAIRPPEDHDRPGGEALERLRALDEWVSDLPPHNGHDGSLHDKLTHVVDETAAICETIGRELFGHGAAAPPAGMVES